MNNLYVVAMFVMLFACTSKNDIGALDLEHYEPVDKFVPAYEALNNRTDLSTGKDYDIEQTVRVINALEIAQANSKNFNDFLMMMARQDYTGVAPDVMEAKQRLLPILQYMYKLQAMDEQLSDLWLLARSAASGGTDVIDGKNIAGITLAMMGEPIAILSILGSDDANRATNSAFSQYEKDKKLKSDIRADIERLRASYMQYLTDYAPIYHKYMKEYDLICIEKDRAYIDLYSGQPTSALIHSQRILDKYPTNCDAMLLKSFRLMMGGNGAASTNGRRDLPQQSVVKGDSILAGRGEVLLSDTMLTRHKTMNDAQWEADMILSDYMQHYPDRSAPALVLKGVLSKQMGDVKQAMA